MSRRVRIVFITIVCAAAVAALVWVFAGKDRSNKPDSSNNGTPTTSQQTTSNPTNPAQNPKQYTIKVYFSKHPESDDDPTKVYAVSRTSTDLGVAKAAMRQLIAGPTSAEKAAGYFTDVRLRNDASNCNGADFTLSIKNTKATLRFCRTFDAVGVLSDGRANENIRATLLQFSSVRSVVVLNKDGHCQFDLSGEDRCLQQ